MGGKRQPYGDISSGEDTVLALVRYTFHLLGRTFLFTRGLRSFDFSFPRSGFRTRLPHNSRACYWDCYELHHCVFWIGHLEDVLQCFVMNRDSRSSRGVRFSLAALTVKCYRETGVIGQIWVELPDISKSCQKETYLYLL